MSSLTGRLLTYLARPAIAAVLLFGLLSSESCDRSHPSASPAVWVAGNSPHRMLIGGEDRGYLLHIPPSPGGGTAAFPLVVMLHGSGARGEIVRKQSGFDSVADVNGVVTAYPDGLGGLFGKRTDWNAGKCCGAPVRGNVDDVGFIKAMIAEISRNIPIDARRIYIAGFSDGGRMAYHFACVASPAVAAIGVVAGSLVDARCAPALPVPVAIIHGTADNSVPYSERSLSPTPTVNESELSALPPAVQFWAAQNGCSGIVTRAVGLRVVNTVFRECTRADVTLYTLDRGLHSWPGGKKDGARGQEPSPALDASDVLLKFFLAHTR